MNHSGSGLAEQQLPAEGWAFEYLALEAPRRGWNVFRPVVPVRLSDGQPSTLGALVDSGSEHTLAAGWLAEDLGVDLDQNRDRLLLWIVALSKSKRHSPISNCDCTEITAATNTWPGGPKSAF